MSSNTGKSIENKQAFRSSEVTQEGELLLSLVTGIDRNLPVALHVQLRGVIEYGILLGQLPAGLKLPSVRELAEQAGVATMTVVGVYTELKERGLIETRSSAGTFVAEIEGLPGHDAVRKLNPLIDALLETGRSLGIDAGRITEQVGARANLFRIRPPHSLKILLVGLFEQATAAYADYIRTFLNKNDQLEWTTVARMAGTPAPAADVVLTLVNHRAEVQALFPRSVPVVGLNFVPSEQTRTSLAGLSPAARVGVVSTFPDFMALMKPNVLRFTPHVASVEVTVADAPDLEDFLKRIDVLVYASGAEWVREKIAYDQQAFEYRHSPDPNNIRDHVLPLLDELRIATLSPKETP